MNDALTIIAFTAALFFISVAWEPLEKKLNQWADTPVCSQEGQLRPDN